MPNLEPNSEDFPEDEDIFLGIVKPLPLTRNEALFLSDSITLLMEHTPEKIGLAVLLTTNTMEEDEDSLYELDLTVADLFLLRECCQSFIKVNNELVGFNLLRKIYTLVLEEDMKERKFFHDMTKGINLDTSTPENIEERKDFNG